VERIAFSVVVPVAPRRTPAVLLSLQALERGGPACEVLTQVGGNASRNRNRCIARSNAPILAFTDDDCAVPPDWLVRAAEFFRAHPDHDVVGGPQLDGPDEGIVGRASGRALASRFGSHRQSRRYRRAAFDLAATQFDLSSANLFITRAAFERWGPFDERLWPNEETALLRSIEADGGRIAYDPTIVVFHRRRPSLLGLARQCFAYGRGRAHQSRLEDTRLPGVGTAVPSAFLLYLIALPWLVPIWRPAMLPLAAYLALAATVAAYSAWRDGDLPAACLMPAAFVAIHLGYAAGFLCETLRGLRLSSVPPLATATFAPAAGKGSDR
jgi:hypothetical protein